MNVNLENYEEYALDYLEGSLPLAQKEAFQTFLLLHPEIQAELVNMEIVKLQPDLSEVFSPREQLYRKNSTTLYWVGLGAALLLLVLSFGTSKLALNQSKPQVTKINQSSDQASIPLQRNDLSEHSNLAGDETEMEAKSAEQFGASEKQDAASKPVAAFKKETNDKIKPGSSSAFPGKELPTAQNEGSAQDEATMVLKKEEEPYRSYERSLPKLQSVKPVLQPAMRHPKIEVIHQSLLDQYSRLLDDGGSKGRFGHWIVQANLVPKAFKSETKPTWKERLLPDYITAE